MHATLHAFLRFAYEEQFLARDLSGLVPAVRRRAAAHLPRALPETCIAALHRTLETLQRYVATTGHLAACSRRTRIASLRAFSRWLQARCPESAILPLDILPRCRERVRFFPITPEQVAALLAAAPAVLPAGGMRTGLTPRRCSSPPAAPR